MSAEALARDEERAAETRVRPRAFETIVYGGLAIGLLDGLFAIVFYGLVLGAPTTRIFQSVASGVFGRPAALEGGTRTFLLGVALHFVVATCIAAVYYVLSLKAALLVRHAVASGLLYGLAAYVVMNYVVIPLSNATPGRFAWSTFLPAFVAHAFLVGLPVALIARWSARKSSSPGVQRK